MPVFSVDRFEIRVLLNNVRPTWWPTWNAAVPTRDCLIGMLQVRVYVMNGCVEQARNGPIQTVGLVPAKILRERVIVRRLLEILFNGMCRN